MNYNIALPFSDVQHYAYHPLTVSVVTGRPQNSSGGESNSYVFNVHHEIARHIDVEMVTLNDKLGSFSYVGTYAVAKPRDRVGYGFTIGNYMVSFEITAGADGKLTDVACTVRYKREIMYAGHANFATISDHTRKAEGHVQLHTTYATGEFLSELHDKTNLRFTPPPRSSR